jgi:hypothetical protein
MSKALGLSLLGAGMVGLLAVLYEVLMTGIFAKCLIGIGLASLIVIMLALIVYGVQTITKV